MVKPLLEIDIARRYAVLKARIGGRARFYS
jgi:hypothetical protein